MADYGYLNHSFIDERDDRAINAIFGSVSSDHVVIEQAWTLGEVRRPAFEKMLAALKPRDAVFISSIDRLGLDAEDAVRLWRVITEEKNADIVVLDDSTLNSRENEQLTIKQLFASAQAAFAAIDAHERNVK